MSLHLMSWKGCQSGKTPAAVETVDLLSVKKETTEKDNDYHTLTLPQSSESKKERKKKNKLQ